MSLHRLLAMRVGVPRPDELAGFYAEVGLATDGDGRVTSPDGGTQVVIEEAPYRQLLSTPSATFGSASPSPSRSHRRARQRWSTTGQAPPFAATNARAPSARARDRPGDSATS